MSEVYNEYHHPGRRKEDREGKHTHIHQQINIRIESHAVSAGGTLKIYATPENDRWEPPPRPEDWR